MAQKTVVAAREAQHGEKNDRSEDSILDEQYCA
jgi:hypothetical protein